MNILMMSWVAGYLPHPQYQAFLCSSGSKGYSAFRRSLEPGYPVHTILLTNIDVRDLQLLQHNDDDLDDDDRAPEGEQDHEHVLDDEQGILSVPGGTSTAVVDSTATVSPKEEDMMITSATSSGTADYFSYIVQEVDPRHRSPAGGYYIPHTSSSSSGSCYSRVLAGYSHVTPITNHVVIPDDFLSHCSSLTSIDFSALTHNNITIIQQKFLYACSWLHAVDLQPFSTVTSISNFFLSNCTSLTSIDFTPLSLLTTLPWGFLDGCSGLTTLDFKPLGNVTNLSSGFLSRCTGLNATLDLTPLSKLQDLPGNFLMGCSSLKSVIFAKLDRVTGIPFGFLSGCVSVASIDLTPLGNIEHVNNAFLRGCHGRRMVMRGGASNCGDSEIVGSDDGIRVLGAPRGCSPPAGWRCVEEQGGTIPQGCNNCCWRRGPS